MPAAFSVELATEPTVRFGFPVAALVFLGAVEFAPLALLDATVAGLGPAFLVVLVVVEGEFLTTLAPVALVLVLVLVLVLLEGCAGFFKGRFFFDTAGLEPEPFLTKMLTRSSFLLRARQSVLA